jgi:type III secretory pathway lipoprotein EscJ
MFHKITLISNVHISNILFNSLVNEEISKMLQPVQGIIQNTKHIQVQHNMETHLQTDANLAVFMEARVCSRSEAFFWDRIHLSLYK